MAEKVVIDGDVSLNIPIDGGEVTSTIIDGGVDVNIVRDGDAVLSRTLDGEGSWAYIAGGGGTNDYNNLYNKPKIEGVTLVGDKTYEELNLQRLTNSELEEILQV